LTEGFRGIADSSLTNAVKLIPGNRELFEKLTVTQLLNKFPDFQVTRRVITVYNSPPMDPVLSQMNPVQILTPHVFENLSF
jgi:hypothetical protein